MTTKTFRQKVISKYLEQLHGELIWGFCPNCNFNTNFLTQKLTHEGSLYVSIRCTLCYNEVYLEL